MKRDSAWRGLLLVVLAGLAANPAQAIHVRSQGGGGGDGGFFLRLSGGFGAQGTAAEVPFEEGGAGEMEFTGDGVDLNFAIGGFVTEDLALHATIFGWTLNDPEFSWGAIALAVPSELSLSAVGAGLTWYALPSGLYFSASLGFADLNLEDAESGTGVALDVTLGKEWWVSSRWSLGLAGAYGWHRVPEDGLADDWSGHGLGLRFSASLR